MKKLLMLAVLTALSTTALQATVMSPMFMDDLTESSQTVVHGSIAAKRAEWAPDHHMIYTVYTVEPRRYLKGSLGASFEIREPGGELDGEGFYVASVPQFEIGEEAILFLWTDATGGHQVTAFDQGAVPVADTKEGKKAVRPIPLGSAHTEQRSSALVGSAAEVVALQPNVALSEQSLSGLLDQIRVSVALTRRAAE